MAELYPHNIIKEKMIMELSPNMLLSSTEEEIYCADIGETSTPTSSDDESDEDEGDVYKTFSSTEVFPLAKKDVIFLGVSCSEGVIGYSASEKTIYWRGGYAGVDDPEEVDEEKFIYTPMYRERPAGRYAPDPILDLEKGIGIFSRGEGWIGWLPENTKYVAKPWTAEVDSDSDSDREPLNCAGDPTVLIVGGKRIVFYNHQGCFHNNCIPREENYINRHFNHPEDFQRNVVKFGLSSLIHFATSEEEILNWQKKMRE